jgi:molybdate transport system ATP-binding protein
MPRVDNSLPAHGAESIPAPRLVARFDLRRHPFTLSIDLAVTSEILVLFGPSGSGKTTTLNAFTGLCTPDKGDISLDGKTLFHKGSGGPTVNLPARSRGIGYVSQQYALFPHLTAMQNIGYALHRKAESRQRASTLLRRMGLDHLADRYPHEMSGGQQQRVAIARALAAAPKVLLLDEPFSALDVAVRERLQADLAELQRELGLVVIYVTHRLEDAFAVGHRLAILHGGQLRQVGPIQDVFRYPASRQVAEVLGLRNLFQARVVDGDADRLLVDWEGIQLEAPPQTVQVGLLASLYIRPEDVKVLYSDRPAMPAVSHNQVMGKIVASNLGPGVHVLEVLLPNGHTVEVRYATHSYVALGLEVGREVRLSLRREALVLIK